MDEGTDDADSNTLDTVVKLVPVEEEFRTKSTISTLEDNDVISIQEKQIKESCAAKSGRYAKIILPHVGLVLLLGAYTLCGAGIFHMVELPYEQQVRINALKKIILTRDSVVTILFNRSAASDYDEMRWKSLAFDQFRILEKVLYQAYEDEFVNLDDIAASSNGTAIRRQMWTMPQAIFFSTAVITMIGYGNLVPRTLAGRIFCIIFGLFGIPLLLVTVADIGKFLADLMKFLYNSYQACKRQFKGIFWINCEMVPSFLTSCFKLKVTRQRFANYRKKCREAILSMKQAPRSKSEMRLPWIMVLFILVTYAAGGALLFHIYEGWGYFESFYFCFITMATVGFGDIVPTQEVYMFFTIAYIVIGLALTTMCIDLAGLEYVERIHSFGQKIDAAKGVVGGAVVSGLHAGENLLKIRAVGGRLVPVRGLGSINIPAGMSEEEYLYLQRRGLGSLHYDILSSPISPEVQRLLKPHIKIKMDELKESDAYTLENKTFNKPVGQLPKILHRRRRRKTRQQIESKLARSQSWPKRPPAAQKDILIVAPFLFKESDV